MKKSRVLNALSAMAHETRLDIIRQLVPLGTTGLSAGEIGRTSKVPASRLSFHLSSLENAGLISSQRVSRNIIYSINHKTLGEVIGYLMNDCCQADPKICASLTLNHTPS